jgi:sodium-dependent phosphate cotransporter
MSAEPATRPPAPRRGGGLFRIVQVLGLLFLFLLGVDGLGDGFKLLGGDLLDAFFNATGNPLVGLVVGILGTTLVQSSSVTTSMIVGLVAAPANPLPLANAIPMVMGANIGTTVTNTLVSMGHIGRPEEFRRAFAVATCHDFFNFFAVLVLLPLEWFTGFLQRLAIRLASLLEGTSGYQYESPLTGALEAAMVPLHGLGTWLFGEGRGLSIFLILVSAGLIFTALLLLVRVMRSAMQSRVERFVTGVLGSSALLSMAVGAIATVMVQSSSITTSLLVPLGGAALITLPQAFPITLGANVGTTVTALLAAMAVSGPNASAGIEIALVHLLFNFVGILLVYPFEPIRNIPLASARWLADAAVRSRTLALAYVFGLFYGLPALLVILDRLLLP